MKAVWQLAAGGFGAQRRKSAESPRPAARPVQALQEEKGSPQPCQRLLLPGRRKLHAFQFPAADVEDDSESLCAVLYCPGEADTPCARNAELAEIADCLAPLGIHVFGIDPPSGPGTPRLDVKDIAETVTYLRTSKKVAKVVVWGRSGAAVEALRAAAADPSLAGLVCDGAYADVPSLLAPEWAEAPITQLAKLGKDLWAANPVAGAAQPSSAAGRSRSPSPSRPWSTSKGGSSWFSRAGGGSSSPKKDDVRPVQIAMCCFVPAMFLHGTMDEAVPMSHSRALRNAYAGEAKLLLVEGADHDSRRPLTTLAQVSLFVARAFRKEDSGALRKLEAAAVGEVKAASGCSTHLGCLVPVPEESTHATLSGSLLGSSVGGSSSCGSFLGETWDLKKIPLPELMQGIWEEARAGFQRLHVPACPELQVAYYLPSGLDFGEEPRYAVVYCPSEVRMLSASGGEDMKPCTEVVEIAKRFLPLGIAVLSLEGNNGITVSSSLSNSVSVAPCRSNGSNRCGSNTVTARDVIEVVKYMRESKHVQRIGLWGRSMGAATALQVAELDPTLAGLVCDGAFAQRRCGLASFSAPSSSLWQWTPSPFAHLARLGQGLLGRSCGIAAGSCTESSVLSSSSSSDSSINNHTREALQGINGKKSGSSRLLHSSTCRRRSPSPYSSWRRSAKAMNGKKKRRKQEEGKESDGSTSPMQIVSRCFVPALFLHPALDSSTLSRHGQELREAYGGEVKMLLVEGDHDGARPPAVLAQAVLFLARAFRCDESNALADVEDEASGLELERTPDTGSQACGEALHRSRACSSINNRGQPRGSLSLLSDSLFSESMHSMDASSHLQQRGAKFAANLGRQQPSMLCDSLVVSPGETLTGSAASQALLQLMDDDWEVIFTDKDLCHLKPTSGNKPVSMVKEEEKEIDEEEQASGTLLVPTDHQLFMPGGDAGSDVAGRFLDRNDLRDGNSAHEDEVDDDDDEEEDVHEGIGSLLRWLQPAACHTWPEERPQREAVNFQGEAAMQTWAAPGGVGI